MPDFNYYKVGGSLDYQNPSYVVRQADSDLYEGLKNGDFCYVLNSRQMGKSSLRVRTMKRLQGEGISCASIDITNIGSHSLTVENWFGGIAFELLCGFDLLGKVNFNAWWGDRNLLSPLQRLNQLFKEVLLAGLYQNIVIFIDEIDSIIEINFKDDFFAFIRFCYNQRVDNPEYNRLTFCLLGVATPSDLIQDKKRTPFNIGRAIELTGFKLDEAKLSLTEGLTQKVDNPEKVLKAVLDWTGGQPFLTQKLCKLVVENAKSRKPNIKQLVQKYVIDNWESQDEPEHLRTIRDRILSNEQRAGRLLGLYQQILQQGESETNDSPEQMELRLSGLVVKQNGKLRVYNRIYEAVFDQSWIKQELAKLRPYSEAIAAWLDSNRQDESRLLRGKALQDALAWAKNKSLSDEDYAFLTASQQKELEAERQERQILDEAKQEAEQLIKEAQEATRLEREGVIALRQFEAGEEIEALLTAMQAGQALQALVKDGCPLQNYPATSPLLALQVILDNIREHNQIQAHRGEVYSVSFSPDGQYLATASQDSTARLWDLQGNLVTEFKGHQGGINSVGFSPDGQYLATASQDSTTRLWDLQGNLVTEFKRHQGGINSVGFSPDGQYLATASEDSTACLWDLQGNLVTEFRGHQNQVWSISFSPDGQYIATASEDQTARLWDLKGNLLTEFRGHENEVWSVSFSPDGQYIATASSVFTTLWDLQGDQLEQLHSHNHNVLSTCFSPDGQHLVTGSRDRTAHLWNLKNNDKPWMEFRGHQSWVSSVSYSPSGQHLATTSQDGTIHLWNLQSMEPVTVKEYPGRVLKVSFSSCEPRLATTSQDGTVNLWTIEGNLLVELKGHQDKVTSLSFSPDGQRIATASEDCTTRIWDLNGNLLVKLQKQYKVWDVSFSPDGQYIANASDAANASLWDLHGNLVMEFQGHENWVENVGFSPDGQRIATASADDTVRLWDLQGNLVMEFKGHRDWVKRLSFSPNGQYIATTSDDHTARLWDLQGNLLVLLKAFVDRVVASKYFDNGYIEPSNRILDISFSPDGKRIATAFDNGTIRLWDIQGNLLAEFLDFRDAPVESISFSPDGRFLAAASTIYKENSIVRLWRVEGLDELLARGCNWLKDYLVTHPEAREKLKVCQN
jgi:WD40 repeat protein